MYRYLDREMVSLSEGERAMLLAMRDWSFAFHRNRCPVDAVTLRFLSHRLIGGLEPFHALLASISRYGRQRLELGCPCHARVTEGEAMLLALLFPGCGDSTAQLRRVVALVPPCHAAGAVEHLAELRAAMLVAGIA